MNRAITFFIATSACTIILKTSPTARSLLGLSPILETSSNLAKWKGKWDVSQTRWQRAKIHHTLLKYYDSILKGRGTIMVPLCGKTKDLHYLTSMGHDVIGVEGIHKAVAEYADENKAAVVLDAQKDTGKFKPYFETYKGVDNKRGTSLQFLRGDFFLLGAAAKGVFGGVWDRASLVAIEPSMRDTYAKNMGEAMAAGGIMLLSTFWREKGDAAALKAGPPYSVSEKDVRDIYEGLDWVKSVELVETIDYVRDERFKQEVKRWLDAGMTEFKELVFVIKKK